MIRDHNGEVAGFRSFEFSAGGCGRKSGEWRGTDGELTVLPDRDHSSGEIVMFFSAHMICAILPPLLSSTMAVIPSAIMRRKSVVLEK